MTDEFKVRNTILAHRDAAASARDKGVTTSTNLEQKLDYLLTIETQQVQVKQKLDQLLTIETTQVQGQDDKFLTKHLVSRDKKIVAEFEQILEHNLLTIETPQVQGLDQEIIPNHVVLLNDYFFLNYDGSWVIEQPKTALRDICVKLRIPIL